MRSGNPLINVAECPEHHTTLTFTTTTTHQNTHTLFQCFLLPVIQGYTKIRPVKNKQLTFWCKKTLKNPCV